MPSWVPDWTYFTIDPPDYAVNRLDAGLTYHCADGLHDEVDIIDERILSLSGIDIDCISELSTAFRIAGNSVTQLALISQWTDFIYERADEFHRDDRDESLEHAFVRIVFADRFHNDHDIRELQAEDAKRWTAELDYLTQKLRAEGPRATPRLSQAMISQAVSSVRRKLFLSSRGFIGLCPETCQIGDRAFALCKCPSPIFLRPRRGTGPDDSVSYIALGPGYVHGMMNGEAIKLGVQPRKISII